MTLWLVVFVVFCLGVLVFAIGLMRAARVGEDDSEEALADLEERGTLWSRWAERRRGDRRRSRQHWPWEERRSGRDRRSR